MLDLLKKIFGIHSPSKKTLEEQRQVGRWLCEGIIEGMQHTPNDEERERLHRLCEALTEATKENEMLELKDTVELMTSEDYKERFKAEYLQTKIRYNKLHKMVVKAEAHTLNFEPKCSLELLKEQKKYMGMYLHCLEVRAEVEGIELGE